MKFRLLLAFFLFCTIFPHALCAKPDQNPTTSQVLRQWNADLEQSNLAIAKSNLNDEAFQQLRQHLTEIRDDASAIRDNIASEIIPLQDELTALGSPPAKDAQEEPTNITLNRNTANGHLAELKGQVKEIELVILRTDGILERLPALRFQLFTQKAFTRGLSVLDPEVWQKAIPELREKLSAIKNQFEAWQAEQTAELFKRDLVHLILALIAVLALIGPFSRSLSRHFGRIPEVQAPTYAELMRGALVVALVRSLLPMSVAASLYLVLAHDFQWIGGAHDFAFSVLLALLMVILVLALSRAVLAPCNGRWRLMPLNDVDARYVHKIIIGLAWVFAFELVLKVWFSVSGASLELTILWKLLISMLIAVLLLALLIRRPFWRMDIQRRKKINANSWTWRTFHALMALLVLMMPVSSIAGFVEFSLLLGTQIVLTGGLYILIGVVIALCDELIGELLSKETEIGVTIRQNLELANEGSRFLVFWLKAVTNSIIYISALLALLVIWGAGGEDLNTWLYKALFGFNVAGVTISIATLFLAIAFFSGILLLTRLLQRFLEQVILPRTRIDFGIQNSIRTSVGYIGYIVAAGFAISTLGIDLGKLAIIAGALSVGIGFGLQNVVNNFVSGLILLIERPIKVGDWVVVNDMQGYVKKINVRATEIQTFDRASAFIPNSNLISNPLLNWTHADKIGRVIVPVGVAYGTDTRKVQNILLEVAAAHPSVSTSPEPSVLFKSFGDSCLSFELLAFIQDVDKVLTVSSDLLFEIDAAFRNKGIEIPYPQQDVHWRDMERLENLVVKILAEKNAGCDNQHEAKKIFYESDDETK